MFREIIDFFKFCLDERKLAVIAIVLVVYYGSNVGYAINPNRSTGVIVMPSNADETTRGPLPRKQTRECEQCQNSPQS